MDVKLPLRVFKTRVVAWRANLGGAHVGEMEVWNVEDAQGRWVAGDLRSQGSNVESARAWFRRRSEAQRYAQGYTDWLTGRVGPDAFNGGLLRWDVLQREQSRWPAPARHDEALGRAYQEGVSAARVYQNSPSRPLPPLDLATSRLAPGRRP